ncbi:unnamed protein product, partial [Didymodactylos carnosus]
MTDTGLTPRQIQKAVTVFNPQLSNDIIKIRNVARTHRQKNRCSIKFIEDLQTWCSSRNHFPPTSLPHQVFVPHFEVTDVDNTFICLTTRQLLSTCQYSTVLAIDCTYKITTNELPLVVFGTSDLHRHFRPI